MTGDFSTAYMAAKNLRHQVVSEPASLDWGQAGNLADGLADRAHYAQSNARFLYLEMARALAEMAVLAPGKKLRAHCLDILERTVTRGNDKAVLAAGEAMGSLPLNIPAADVPAQPRGAAPMKTWDEVAAAAVATPLTAPSFLGRSLVAPIQEGGFLAVKLARPGPGSAKCLHRESAWMDRLAREQLPSGFLLPRPVRPGGRTVFKMPQLPVPGAPKGLKRGSLAMAFIAPPGYYDYPNDIRPGRLPGPEAFLRMMAQNALFLGFLAARGVMHTAAVPLFHNRVQGGRRPDQGLYQWRRMGRLDRWLESSLYPNFGASGLRDFEHLEPPRCGAAPRAGAGRILDPPDPAHCMGDHALGLLLVAGSYFRAKEPGLRGLDRNGRPVDARRLFDPELLAKAIEAVFLGYVRGFTGQDMNGACPVDARALARRMIEEMGVDRHMEEVIRARDQNDMTRERFRNLLVAGGYKPTEADRVRRGDSDVTILTGPHLGEFNRQTTLPELSLFAAQTAGMAVARRFRSMHGLC